jgi:hypothetical protein
MNGARNQELDQAQDRAEFHLTELVPRDCCHSERVDFKSKLQRLERSLNGWLVAKVEEIESRRTEAGTSAHIKGDPSMNAAARGQVIPTGKQEVILMSTDDRDILKVLQAELDFINQGGYGRYVRTPWKAKSPFEDSLTCINYAYLEKTHSCTECHLIDFVPTQHREEKAPCHFIPLNESGETIDDLESKDNQQKLEEALKTWLRVKIKKIEIASLATQIANSRFVKFA